LQTRRRNGNAASGPLSITRSTKPRKRLRPRRSLKPRCAHGPLAGSASGAKGRLKSCYPDLQVKTPQRLTPCVRIVVARPV
jgi:hypothetical protein